jgi:hydrogenase maturation protease
MGDHTILIAGIGNIFLGDDAFGVEVAQRLAGRPMPAGVSVRDFGIRGLDLTYALMEDYDAIILVDAAPHGEKPGTLYVIEPHITDDGYESESDPLIDTHGMNPMKVLRMVKAMGGKPKRLLLVGCEPATLGPEEGQMGLSEPVQAVMDEAVLLVESLIGQLCVGEVAVPVSRTDP